MAERKATNKYFPPDWDPSKGSINKYKHSHHLRARAKKIDQGILVVRFELPFNIWCLGCQNHIGMGVRYNAEKSRAGNYYSTPIYHFRMKCHLCDNYFEIQTDPKNFDYTVLKGARKQILPSKCDQETQDDIRDEELTKKLTVDAMARLEKKAEDIIRDNERLPTLLDMAERSSLLKDEFAINQSIRSVYRKHRMSLEATRKKDKEILNRSCLSIQLAPSDKNQARDILRESRLKRVESLETLEKSKILSSSLSFCDTQVNKNSSASKLLKSQPRDKTLTARIKKEPNF